MGIHGKSLNDFYYGQFGDNEKFYSNAPKTKSETWVYVIYCYGTNLTKIGITDKIKERVKQICCSTGVLCDLVFAIQLMPEYDECPLFIEKSIHKYFKANRKFGEWFTLSVRDVIQIYNLFWSIEGDDMIDNFRKVVSKTKTL
jgi:hypothetical protein